MTALLNNLSPKNRQRLRFLLWLLFAAVYLGLGTFTLGFSRRLEVGDVANEDIFAPESIIYESDVLTEEAREEARNNVEPAWERNQEVSRQQLTLAENIVEYIDMVRRDTSIPDHPQKLGDLEDIEALSEVPNTTWLNVLNASSTSWANIRDSVVSILRDTMALEITSENLQSTRSQIRVNPSYSDTTQSTIGELVRPLIVPNHELDEAITEARREAAAEAVVPRQKSYDAGEIVVSKGQPINEEELEALNKLGILDTNRSSWQNYLGSFLILTLVSVVLYLYTSRFNPDVVGDSNMLILLASLFLIFITGARLFGPDALNEQSFFPAAALGLVVTTLVGPNLAIIMTIGLAVLVGSMVDNALEFSALVAIGSLAGILSLRYVERLNAYFISGVLIGLSNVVVVVAFALTTGDTTTDLVPIAGDITVGMINGLFAAGVALVIMFVIGNTLNLTTNLKLIELMQPNQPLLKRLLRETPGTYQHSLQVANLAEQATERIGGNSSLVRTAAMYHDIGKMLNPHYFTENHGESFNPHDELDDPFQSARIIIGHVIEGDRMARRYHLPQRIRDFIREHHGTTRPMVFYHRALDLMNGDEDKIDIKDFTYPGPRPQSRETAIMMLADGIESAARGIKPRTEEEIAHVVNMIFEARLEEGQLDESHLTLNDLKAIREVFIETLQGVYHTRISYAEAIARKKQQALTEGTPAHKEIAAVENIAEAEMVEDTEDIADTTIDDKEAVPGPEEEQESAELAVIDSITAGVDEADEAVAGETATGDGKAKYISSDDDDENDYFYEDEPSVTTQRISTDELSNTNQSKETASEGKEEISEETATKESVTIPSSEASEDQEERQKPKENQADD
jgi:hypothetical protein